MTTTDRLTIDAFIEARLSQLETVRSPEWPLRFVRFARVVLAAHRIGGYCFPANEYGPDRSPFCAECGSGEPHEYPAEWPCPTILALAGIWCDHPDYRPEWSTP